MADDKKGIESWCLVIFPIIADDILDYLLIDGFSTDVNSDIFVGVLLLK